MLFSLMVNFLLSPFLFLFCFGFVSFKAIREGMKEIERERVEKERERGEESGRSLELKEEEERKEGKTKDER